MAKTKGAKNGINGATVDKKKFEELCKIQCTEEEIANVFGVSIFTINRFCKQQYGKSFKKAYPILSAEGKTSLRRYQMRLAEKNAVMAIWLGKQYLGQKDVIEENVSEKIEIVNDIPKSEKNDLDE